MQEILLQICRIEFKVGLSMWRLSLAFFPTPCNLFQAVAVIFCFWWWLFRENTSRSYLRYAHSNCSNTIWQTIILNAWFQAPPEPEDLPEPSLLDGEIIASKAQKVLRLHAYSKNGQSGHLYCTNFRICFVTAGNAVGVGAVSCSLCTLTCNIFT